MVIVLLDSGDLQSFPSFHDTFQREFGFPDFYGRNMNAWIDCMTSLDEPNDGLTSVHCAKGDLVTVCLANAGQIPADVFEALNECAAFVNWRRIEVGELPVLALAYHR